MYGQQQYSSIIGTAAGNLLGFILPASSNATRFKCLLLRSVAFLTFLNNANTSFVSGKPSTSKVSMIAQPGPVHLARPPPGRGFKTTTPAPRSHHFLLENFSKRHQLRRMPRADSFSRPSPPGDYKREREREADGRRTTRPPCKRRTRCYKGSAGKGIGEEQRRIYGEEPGTTFKVRYRLSGTYVHMIQVGPQGNTLAAYIRQRNIC